MIKKIYNFRSRVLRPSLDSNYSHQDIKPSNSVYLSSEGSLNSTPDNGTKLDGTILCKSYCKSPCKKEINDICGLREFVRKYPDYRSYI